jgi:hypothetical protein
MANDDTRIRITATDDTRAAFSSVNRGLTEMQRSFGAIQATIATLSGLAGLGFMASWAKDTIAAAAALDDLADATGSTVESLSKLSNIAKVSGSSFETIDAAIKRLAVGMAGVDEESSRAGKALAALGISSKDPAQAMLDIAKSFAGYADGAEKAALAVAIFGKSGASLLPILKDIAENVDIAGTVTGKQAQAAEDLEKSWRRLGLSAGELKNSLLNDIVPALTEVITSFNLARAAGLGFWESIKMTGNYGPQGVAQAIGETVAELDKLRKLESTSTGGWAEEYAKKIDVLEKKLKALKDLQYSMDAPNRAALKAIGDLMGPGLPSAPKVAGGDAASKAQVDFWVKGMGDIADALKAEDAARKAALETLIKENDEMNKALQAGAKITEDITKRTDQYQKEIDALTMSKDAIYERDIAQAKALRTQIIMFDGVTDEVRALEQLIATMEKLRSVSADSEAAKQAEETARAWQRTADSIEQSLTDALMRGFESGKDWATNFAQTLKNLFATLVLRPVIQAVAAPLAGGITGMFSGGANASGGGGLGGAGGLLGGGSWLSGLGDSIFGGGGGAAFGAGFASPLSTLGSIFSGGAEFASGGMALASGLGAAVPVIGAALAIGSIVKGFLDSKRGGDKTGGYGMAGGISGVNRNDLFTPNQADSGAAAIAQTTLVAFKQTLKALGGSGVAGFDIGYNSDPQGTAPNQLGVRSFVNGQQVYGYSAGESLGRDDATLQAAIELETKRALLAALQASDLPAQIAAVFNSVSASGASSATIDNLMAFGQAMKVVIDSIGGSVVEDAQKAWEQSQRSMVQVLDDMGMQVVDLAKNMDGSVGSMEELAGATKSYRQAAIEAIVAIKQLGKDLQDMFEATRVSLRTYGLSPEDLQTFYRNDADAAMAELSTSTDPQRVAVLAARINADINNAFGALPEETKLDNKSPLMGYLDAVDAAVQERLATISALTSSGTEGPFAAASTALDGAASKFTAAADNGVAAADVQMQAANMNLQAAQINLAAAQTPIQINSAATAEVGG